VVDRDCESIVGIHIEQACLSLFVISSIRSLAEGSEGTGPAIAESIADRRRALSCPWYVRRRPRRHHAPRLRPLCFTPVQVY